LRAAIRGLPRPQDLFGLARQRFDGASGRLSYALRSFGAEKRARLDRWRGRLDIRLIAQRADRCKERVQSVDREMRQVLRRLVQQHHVRLGRCGARLQPGLLRHPAKRGRERLDLLTARGRQSLLAAVDRRRRQIDGLAQLLRSLSHRSVLERGFALVRDADGRMVRRLAEAEAAGLVELEFTDGRVRAEILGAAGQGGEARKTSRAPARGEGGKRKANEKTKQGQLF
jgi:exodeoxyribonuclease VII large subunit